MTKSVERTALRAVSVAGMVICVLVALWGWQSGILTSQERLTAFVAGCGSAGALLFVVFQAVQVVVPILPGGLGCLAGVLLFGPWWGFVYNYIGICCFPRRPLINTAAGRSSKTASPGFLPWPSFSLWRRMTFCAIWRAPRT